MRITVLGAGAMGSLFGGGLAESGQDVTLIDVNDAHLEAIRASGLRLETDRGDRRITRLVARRPEAATEAPDLLIVFTKTLHTGSALEGVRHLIDDHTHVLSLQNGLGNVETIAQFLPSARILVGVTTWPADMVAAGHVHSHGEGAIRLWAVDGTNGPALAQCVEALTAAGLRCTADPNVWASIWEKVAFNAALNSICAVTRCTVDQIDLLPEGRDLALRIVGEVTAVARATGVAADPDKPSSNVLHAMAHHRGHKPSMLQDVLAGRPTEIEAINGAVVAAAVKAGVPATCTQVMATLVRLIDARGSAQRQR
ncbi:ketopantoate reductase family protein [Ideonella sp. YS5]|uniref:ketopantoate reductase family protein n=1 Tax=Ideonella sp. YS5 TaxID=3453714 RepID=UPI003EE9B26C